MACVDTGHALLTGTAPEKFLSGMNAATLGALHLHDNDGKDDLHLLPTRGVIAWESVLTPLKKIGYRGDLTLEIMFFLERFTPEELPAALCLAGEVALSFREKLST